MFGGIAITNTHNYDLDDLVLQDEKGRLVPPESGAATVMDIHTGEIKLMVSVPGYDPNLF